MPKTPEEERRYLAEFRDGEIVRLEDLRDCAASSGDNVLKHLAEACLQLLQVHRFIEETLILDGDKSL